jgi:hypothetical protein
MLREAECESDKVDILSLEKVRGPIVQTLAAKGGWSTSRAKANREASKVPRSRPSWKAVLKIIQVETHRSQGDTISILKYSRATRTCEVDHPRHFFEYQFPTMIRLQGSDGRLADGRAEIKVQRNVRCCDDDSFDGTITCFRLR